MTIIDIEQGSEAWYRHRAGKITGTRFATLMSGDSTKGYKDLINELAGETISGVKDDSYSNAIMERGVELEPEARAVYEIEMDCIVDKVGFCLMDGYEDWVGVSPDGITDLGMIEIKCPLIKTHMSYIEANRLPNEYKCQVQGNLLATGLDYCDFMSYYPGLKPFILRVEPDKEMHERLIIEIDKAISIVKARIMNYYNYNYNQTDIKNQLT